MHYDHHYDAGDHPPPFRGVSFYCFCFPSFSEHLCLMKFRTVHWVLFQLCLGIIICHSLLYFYCCPSFLLLNSNPLIDRSVNDGGEEGSLNTIKTQHRSQCHMHTYIAILSKMNDLLDKTKWLLISKCSTSFVYIWLARAYRSHRWSPLCCVYWSSDLLSLPFLAITYENDNRISDRDLFCLAEFNGGSSLFN